MPANFYDTTYYAPKKLDPSQVERLKAMERRANAFYRSQLEITPGEKLLDIGCGKGDFIEAMEDTGAELWGIDISRIAVEKARRKLLKPEQVICGDADPLPFDDADFDWVTAWGVLEHFTDINGILLEIRRVLKPSGRAAIMVPNVYYYKFIFDNLRKGKGPTRHQKCEHLLAFGDWQSLIETAGFKSIRTGRHNKFNKPYLAWWRNTIPFYLSNHFVFVCRKEG